MALLSERTVVPQDGFFCIYRRGVKQFGVRVANDGSAKEIPLYNVDCDNDILSTIKFFIEYGGFNLSVASLSVNKRVVTPISGKNRHKSMGTIKTNIGDLYVKKTHNPDVSCLLSEGKKKYDIMVGIRGIIQIIGDPDYKYGIILDQCYDIKKMTLRMIINGLTSLDKLHNELHFVHGDCSPENIMADINGNLKLIDPCNILNSEVGWMRTDYYDSLTYMSDMRAFILSCFQIAAKISNCPVEELYFSALNCITGLDIPITNDLHHRCGEMIKANVDFVDYVYNRFRTVKPEASRPTINYTRIVISGKPESRRNDFEGPSESDDE